MSKQSGLGWTEFQIDDASGTPQDLRTDTTNLTFSTPRAVQDVTGLDKSAHERLLLLADFTGQANGVNDPSSNAEHDVFKTISSTSVNRTVGITVNGCILANECILTDYQWTRSNSGELTWQVPFQLADGTVPTWTGA